MMRPVLVLVALAACHPSPRPPDPCRVRAEIEAVIAQAMQANRAKDIDGFMATFDDEFILDSNEQADRGRTIDRSALSADILRDWSITVRFYEVEQWITAIESVTNDTAVIETNQLYHRTFSKPDGSPGEDDVMTTQRHRETWKKRADGWKLARVEELGGAIYVNGRPYTGE
jgi:hypothetical protein